MIKRAKGIFGFGLVIERGKLFWNEECMCYHGKLFIGWWIVTFNIHTRALKKCMDALSSKRSTSSAQVPE